MSQPPIAPGPEQPDATPPQPPVYQPAPQPPPGPYPPYQPTVPAAKVAGSTLVVIAVVIGVFCVLPALICGGLGVLGSITQ